MNLGGPPVGVVIDVAARCFGVDPDELRTSRHRPIPSYRRAVLLAAREVTGRGVIDIGRAFGLTHWSAVDVIKNSTEQERFWAQVIAEEALTRWHLDIPTPSPPHPQPGPRCPQAVDSYDPQAVGATINTERTDFPHEEALR